MFFLKKKDLRLFRGLYIQMSLCYTGSSVLGLEHKQTPVVLLTGGDIYHPSSTSHKLSVFLLGAGGK